MSRLEKLLAMLREDPGDQFLRYAVAMEYQSAGDAVESGRRYRELIAGANPYLPAFFMLGQLLAGEGEVAAARDVLRDGAEKARAAGDLHLAGEMSEFLASLGAFGD